MSQQPTTLTDIQLRIITDPDDLIACHDITCACFGVQNPDAIHAAFNPGWQTPEGRQSAIDRLKDRFAKTTYDDQGRPITIYIKVTIPASSQAPPSTSSYPPSPSTSTSNTHGAYDPTAMNIYIDSSNRKIIGYAIWDQMSAFPSHGNTPDTDFAAAMGLDKLYPTNPKMQRYISQVIACLTEQRNELVKSLANSIQPTLLGLDMCIVDPGYQGKGVGGKLVQWGLDEAERRGGLECILESSKMGRGLYRKMGFVQVGEEITYEEVEDRDLMGDLELPPNVFMRTKPDRIV